MDRLCTGGFAGATKNTKKEAKQRFGPDGDGLEVVRWVIACGA